MVRIVWLVQVVLYPLFAQAHREAHPRLTSSTVRPPMLLEAAIAIALLLAHGEDHGPSHVRFWQESKTHLASGNKKWYI